MRKRYEEENQGEEKSKISMGCRSLKIQFKSLKSSEDNWKVPNKVHFLWLGFPITDKYLGNIRTFIGSYFSLYYSTNRHL